MTLIIEDGTGKVDSQSYVSATDARAYALARGVTLSATDSVVEAFLLNAMDYIEAMRARFQGSRTTPETQALQWPRKDVVIDGDYELPEDAIPVELVRAQCQLVMELTAGYDLMPSGDGRLVKKSKVDVIETEYFSPADGASGGPSFPKVDALLAPLLVNSSGFALTSVRI